MIFRGFSDCNKLTLCLLSSNADQHCENILSLLPLLLLWFESIYGCVLVCLNFDVFTVQWGISHSVQSSSIAFLG